MLLKTEWHVYSNLDLLRLVCKPKCEKSVFMLTFVWSGAFLTSVSANGASVEMWHQFPFVCLSVFECMGTNFTVFAPKAELTEMKNKRYIYIWFLTQNNLGYFIVIGTCIKATTKDLIKKKDMKTACQVPRGFWNKQTLFILEAKVAPMENNCNSGAVRSTRLV